VLSIITQGYNGTIGNIIVVHAVDDFKVSEVYVAVYDSSGRLIENGKAACIVGVYRNHC
jgi:hypothetical protein